jgi:hypothetical protein
MSEIKLIPMSGNGYLQYVSRQSISIGNCYSEAPNGDFFIAEKVNLPTVALCPVKGRVNIGHNGQCLGPVDNTGCEYNYH